MTRSILNAFARFAVSATLASLAAAQNHTLGLYPGSFVEFPHDPIMNTGDAATIEAWVLGKPWDVLGSSLSVFSRYADMTEHKELVINDDGSIRYLYAGSPWEQLPSFGGAPAAPPGSFPIDGKWHHVAFVRHLDGTWQVFVDGQEKLAMGPGTGLGSGCWITCDVINAATVTKIAVASTWSSNLGWFIDELRVSNVDRYAAAFTPGSGWSADADTAMLVKFDEGQGALVGDDGPAGQVGAINGGSVWHATCCIPVDYQPCAVERNLDYFAIMPQGSYYCDNGVEVDPDVVGWYLFLYWEDVSWFNEAWSNWCFVFYDTVETDSWSAYQAYLACVSTSSQPESCLADFRDTCESIALTYDAQFDSAVMSLHTYVRNSYAHAVRQIYASCP
ncbi:MAG: LamG domain-containing protein [Planctomycetes bacterium]|nr:LamG domain-containing protein [Planctomycetota bacterium]